MVLHLPPADFTPGHMIVRTLSDADFAGDLYTSKSTSGYWVFLENHLTKSRLLVDWGSKLQVSVAGSTPDAELAAVHRSTLRSSIPMQLMIEGLYEFETPIFHECDNSPCLKTIENGASETLRYLAKTQRVNIPLLNSIFHSSHDSNDISHIGTEYNTADIFTKFLGALKHSTFSRDLSLKKWQEVYGEICPY